MRRSAPASAAVREDRVEQKTAHRGYAADIARPLWPRRHELEVLLAQVKEPKIRGASGPELFRYAEPVEERNCRRLENMRRQGVTRKRRPLHHRHSHTLTRKQRR
jgi:hypothetical protein